MTIPPSASPALRQDYSLQPPLACGTFLVGALRPNRQVVCCILPACHLQMSEKAWTLQVPGGSMGLLAGP